MELNSGATKQNNRHSQVACRICGKTMRDDTMKRHMKTHADLNAMDEDKKRAELERRKEAHEYREKQREETRTIAREIGAPPSCYEQSTLVNFHGDDLRSRLRKDKRKHAEKVELGREIEAIIRCRRVGRIAYLRRQECSRSIL